jgi:uncharacterized protein YkwD
VRGHDGFVRAGTLVVILLTLAGAVFVLWPRDSGRAADPCGAVDAKPSVTGPQAAAQTTLCLLNRERAQRGLAPLRENGLLSAASLEHSQDMVRRRYFEHATPDGRSVGDRLRAAGYARGRSASAGENIAFGFGRKSTPASIVAIWMNSPGHREDVLRPSFTEIGIGIARGAPELPAEKQADSATYTTDFGGVVDPSLPSG